MEGSIILSLQAMQSAKTQPKMPNEVVVSKYLHNLKCRDEEAIVCTPSSCDPESLKTRVCLNTLQHSIVSIQTYIVKVLSVSKEMQIRITTPAPAGQVVAVNGDAVPGAELICLCTGT